MKGMTQEQFNSLDGAAKALFIAFFWVYMMLLALPMATGAALGSQIIVNLIQNGSFSLAGSTTIINVYSAMADMTTSNINNASFVVYLAFHALAAYVLFKTALLGWWSANMKASITISKIEMKTYRFKVYGLMTLNLLLIMSIFKLIALHVG